MMRLMILALLSFSVSGMTMKKVDLAWKARGLQAVEAIDKLRVKNGDSRGKNLSKQELCQWKVEGAYLVHAMPKDFPSLKQETETNVFYKLLLRGAEDEFSQVNVNYEKTKKGVSLHLVKLADGWGSSVFENTSKAMILIGDECVFLIPLNDPTSIETMPGNE